jgi:VCBS repeat-containing protein
VTPDDDNPLGGTLVASVTDAATGDGAGTVTWTYTVANADTQFLAQGQKVEETFTVRIADNDGGFVDQAITVTVTGTNDAPTISVASGDSAAGEFSEIAGRTGSTHQHVLDGTLTFTDVDVADNGHVAETTSVTASGASAGLNLSEDDLSELFSATVTTGTGSDGTVGQIGWSFAAEDAVFDYLKAGETLILTYTVSVSDEHGGSSSQDVVITVHGADEGPILDFVVSDFSGGQGQSEFRNIEMGTLKDDSIHLLLTSTDADKQIDSTSNDVGIGPANRRVNAGEGIRAEVVTNASGDQKDLGSLQYAGHLMALAFVATMATVHGEPATAFVRAVDADDDNNFDTDADSGDVVTEIALIRVTKASDGTTYEITDFEMSNDGQYVVVRGLETGDTLTVVGAEPFNRVEIVNAANELDATETPFGGGDFLLTDIGFDVEQIITGTDGDDFLLGTEGDDVLIGLGGLNTLQGNGGDDVFVLTDLSIHDVIVDYDAGDVIDLTRLGFEVATGQFNPAAAEEFVQYEAETGSLRVDVDGAGGPAQFVLAAELMTKPLSVVVRLTDGSTTDDVAIA